jgi:hypothetical protein
VKYLFSNPTIVTSRRTISSHHWFTSKNCHSTFVHEFDEFSFDYTAVVDSDFSLSKGILIKPDQDNPEGDTETMQSIEAKPANQFSECGMWQIQA